MSDLNPRGVDVVIGEEGRKLLFTINVIDEIQDRLNMPFLDAIQNIVHTADGLSSKEDLQVFSTVLSILTDIPVEDIRSTVDIVALRKLSWKMLEAYGISMPEPSEDEDDEDTDDPKMTAGT